MGRHAAVALLNASNPDVSYPDSVAEVIGEMQNAYNAGEFEATKNEFADQNEEGCLLT